MSDGHADATEERRSTPLWRNRSFRRFFLGQFVTNAGDSLYTVAIVWLVFRLSGSSLLTGVANALLLLPFLLQIVAGPLVDRLPLKRVLVGTQIVQGLVVLVLPAAAFAGELSVWLVLVVVPALSLMTLLMSPMQTTLLPRILEEENLSRGNSALATVTLGLDMLFDAAGGLFIAAFGATTLFLVDSLTFAVAGGLFLGVVVPAVDAGGDGGVDAAGEGVDAVLEDYLDDLREGIEVLRGTQFVELLLTAAVFNFAVGVTLATLPAFGARIGGPAAYGLLLGALGVGRLVGSLLAPRAESLPYGRMKAVAYLASALCWLGSVAAPSTALTLGLFGLAWVSAGADGVLTSTLNQRVFPGDLLGRVSATKGTASTATLPVGSLVGGALAELLGVTLTMQLAAAGFGFVGLYVLGRPPLRRLPPIAGVAPEDLGVDVDRFGDDEPPAGRP